MPFGIGRNEYEDILLLAKEFRGLRSSDSERLNRYSEYRKELDSSRMADIFGAVADVSDYGNRRTMGTPKRHNIPVPLGRAMTIKHSHRIAGAEPEITVDRREESAFERYRSETMEKIVWAIIRASGDRTAFKDGAMDGSELGTAAYDIYFNEKKQLPIFKAIDPAGMVVVPGADDPHDFQRVYRFWTVPLSSLLNDYRGMEFRGKPVSEILSPLTDGQVTLCQMCDKKEKIRFVIEGEADSAKILPIWEETHDLGFAPYVLIPNVGRERDIYGWGDYEMVRGLVHYIPTLLSREADLFRAVAGGAYQDSGSGQSATKILDIIRKGGVAPTKKGAEIKPIPTPEIPSFADRHAADAMELLKMVGFAPDAAWGNSGATSGSDRGLQLAPLIELTAMKQVNWANGMTRLFSMALQMLEKKSSGGRTTRYYGTAKRGNTRQPFVLGPFGPDVEAMKKMQDGSDLPAELSAVASDEDFLELPRSPEELFQGDYCVHFDWNNRVDPDDPAYVASELNKFAQGLQSAETTLNNLGIQNAEDELKRIEAEAERFPWMRDGIIKMIQMQIDGGGQGAGGGAPLEGDPAAAANGMAGADTAATDTDFLTQSLAGGQTTPYGGA